MPDKIKVDVPTLILEDFEQAFYVRTVEETTRKPALTEEMILAWADAHYEATRRMGQRCAILVPL